MAGRRIFCTGRDTLPPDSAQPAAQALRHAGDTFVTAFETCDVVLSPTLTTLPWSLGTLDPALGREELIERTERLVGYTPIHNAAGCPSCSAHSPGHHPLRTAPGTHRLPL